MIDSQEGMKDLTYNHLIYNKHKWNNYFTKTNHKKILPNLTLFLLADIHVYLPYLWVIVL